MTPRSQTRADHVSLKVWVSVVVLLFLFAAQNVFEMRRESSTFDEVAHLPAGYTYLVKRDFRLNPEHPPLLKILSALPLLAICPQVDFGDPSWNSPPNQYGFGSRFLYSNNADRLLFWGRLPSVAIAVLLGFFVFRWAQQLYGNAAGLFALTLFAFSPDVIAHSHLVTTDMGVTAFLTVAFYFLWRHACFGEKRSLCLSSLAMGAALASKFSALVLLPVAAFLLWNRHTSNSLKTVSAIAGPLESGAKRHTRTKPRKDWKGERNGHFFQGQFRRSFFQADRSKVTAVLVFVVLSSIVVQLSYMGSLDPSLYFKGMALVNKNHRPYFPFYLHGQFKQGGWWYYFPVTFLVKATAPFVILIFSRLILLLQHWRGEWKTAMFLALPPAAIFVSVSAFADPLGVRYLLPAFPFLMIFSSGMIKVFAKKTFILGGLGILLGWHVASSAAVFPHHLSYFNEFVGGPAHGMEWLDDSNVDWGQELKSLKKIMDERGILSVTLFSFSPFDNPGYYGIECSRPDPAKPITPAPGFYVFSAHVLVRTKPFSGYDWRERFPVVANLGHSMYVFKVP